MSSSKIRFAAIVGGALLATAFVLPTSSAMASGRSCQLEAGSLGDSCVAVSGSGLHVNSVTGSYSNLTASLKSNVHIQLTGPQGVIKNCGQTNVAGNTTTNCTWSPNANEPAGNYCTTTWQYGGGTYTDIGHACVGVHS